ncbi:MAG: Bro-N domain-containing protein [Bacillota bacterium]
MQNLQSNHQLLQTFTYQISDTLSVELRAIADQNGNPWLIANDVARALGYKIPKDAVSQHCKKYKSVLQFCEENGVSSDLVGGGKTPPLEKYNFEQSNLIPESDMYKLIIRSDLESAVVFQDWVTSEVLPAIRKNGGYIKVNQGDSDADIMAKALLIATKTIEEKDRRIAEEISKRGQISSAREASVMGKLSAANKKLKQIRDIIDPILDSKVDLTPRQQLNALARLYAKQNNVDFQEIWNEIYLHIYYTESINIRLRSANAGYKNKLEYVENKHPELFSKMLNFMENKFLEKLN